MNAAPPPASLSARGRRVDIALLLVAVLGLLSAPGGWTSVFTHDRSELVGLAQSIVRVETERSDGGLSIGSAVTVAPAILVTNCHVTRDARAIYLSGRGRLWRVERQYPDEFHDLCFLRAPGWPGRPVALGDVEAVHLGQKVVALGFGGGTAIVMQAGHVRALHRHEGTRIIDADAAFTSGASGGGLFDADGALVGLLTFRARDAGNHYYSVPASWIRDRLATVNSALDLWLKVAPLPGAAAFWQVGTDQLPLFLRIGVFEAQERWSAVLDACRYWVVADPRNPEPYVARGRSYQHLGYPLAAIEALSAALHRAPEHAGAWFELGMVYVEQSDGLGIERVERTLDDLDVVLAKRLRNAAVGATH